VANYIFICVAVMPHHAEPPLTWPVHTLSALGMQSLVFGDKNLVVVANRSRSSLRRRRSAVMMEVPVELYAACILSNGLELNCWTRSVTGAPYRACRLLLIRASDVDREIQRGRGFSYTLVTKFRKGTDSTARDGRLNKHETDVVLPECEELFRHARHRSSPSGMRR
jgi:hypothetical protein